MESNSVFFVLRMNRTNKCKSIYYVIKGVGGWGRPNDYVMI